VVAGGHPILRGVNLAIAAGEHVALVGSSGSGKSTLVGVLQGWHRPARGRVVVDGEPLEGARLVRLRDETAWIEPGVQLWNRSLGENLRYGRLGSEPALDRVLEDAEIFGVLEKLPDGLATRLGEGGGLVSGGEGQRVCLGRAMHRPDARLVILDEAFRALPRDQRRRVLANARRIWSGATLLCITHDILETVELDRVVVLERGTVVEAGRPAELLADAGSRYRALHTAAEAARAKLWASPDFRRLGLQGGELRELGVEAAELGPTGSGPTGANPTGSGPNGSGPNGSEPTRSEGTA